MLVTPFMLVMLRFLVNRYGPPVSVMALLRLARRCGGG
jgi:hypothetical protein